ncbi:hypothetical protein [Bordetella trematum]|uniref:hypothetical protein n=1 Tax=Bordetella trematum TaxID=123899 RepID=UPI0020939CFA|nr:hypothetical protein [Bordetella trematum]
MPNSSSGVEHPLVEMPACNKTEIARTRLAESGTIISVLNCFITKPSLFAHPSAGKITAPDAIGESVTLYCGPHPVKIRQFCND